MSKIIFKPAPRTKWRFVKGSVTEHLYTPLGLWDAAEVDDEALSTSSFDEEEFEEEVGWYISQLEAEGVTDQKEILWRVMQTGLMAENALTAKDILKKLYQRIADLEEYQPTTISGYGITDAYISNGTITIGSNSVSVAGVYRYKGSVSTVANLPTHSSSPAPEPGDVYNVTANGKNYAYVEYDSSTSKDVWYCLTHQKTAKQTCSTDRQKEYSKA